MDEEESAPVFEQLTLLIDHLIGEAASMRFIRNLTILRKPPEDGGFLLSELPERIAALEPRAKNYTHRDIVEERLDYWLKPEKEAEINFDIRFGWTAAPYFINSYRSGESEVVDVLHRQGIAVGFFFSNVQQRFLRKLPKRWIERSLRISEACFPRRHPEQHRLSVRLSLRDAAMWR